MSTHAGIGIQDANGTVRAIYCHHDGYLEHVGKTLLAHFNSRERAEALLALGSISCLSGSGRLDFDRAASDRHERDAGTEAYHRDQRYPWAESALQVFPGPASWHKEVGYEHEYLWMPLSQGEGPEGWYKHVGGGWAPLAEVRVA